jgi:hypothetical protein
MQDHKMDHLAINTIRTKSTEAVQTAKSEHPGTALRSTTPVTRRKRWHFASLIVLMSLGAIAVIVYLLRSVLAERYEGLGAALCAIACGGFLVWHLIHLFAEEDQLQLNANQETVSPPDPDPAGQTNLTTPPPESGQNIK